MKFLNGKWYKIRLKIVVNLKIIFLLNIVFKKVNKLEINILKLGLWLSNNDDD